ncbi:DUF31 family putative serine protease [Mycoplasma seminis]|uniref:DUF31 domain-containing protein n=1 Tax=Mycoplasma seminis TaxID=512749 RepID=A0ABY9H9B3_9MOLU|nr:hypothetical protein [Mycoplasma seminis]WLP85179.1 hypothetical protein Q8852_02545 [Mycoplasma seminis]
MITQHLVYYLSNDIKKYFGDIKYSTQPSAEYFAGYPFVNQRENKVMYNVANNKMNVLGNTISGYTHNPFIVIDQDNGEANRTHGLQFNNEQQALFYGLAYRTFQNSEVLGGASGSMMTNEANLPIGLVLGHETSSTRVLNDENKWITLHTALSIAFSLNRPFYSNKTHSVVQTYNLIDGSDKSKHPHQITSYREQLYKVYGNSYQTTLFTRTNEKAGN